MGIVMRSVYDDYLAHFGIFGQKWGVRRFQNEDGTLTEEGRKRYGKELEQDLNKNWVNAYNEAANKFNVRINDVNAKYKEANLNNPNPGEIELKYVKEAGKLWKSLYEESADKYFGNNPLWKEVRSTSLSQILPMYSSYDDYADEILALIKNKTKA